ncbi:tail fiber protein [Dysgonomonas sp. 520]|uniref:tail fiber protein n=1 Tax=Dysgonomonas sp. 520 TaxID=2302931 RepID=UPI0013D19F65|nr:tail fiber protein [Dysgonomonas sp. 520]NDW10441.1 hypothetical protein [Dysgonomonas sp. 520]
MNSINFTGQDQFPLSIETMSFLQAMIMQSANLAQLGGDTYILSGCETVGSSVSAGYVVINGEVLPFEGGTRNSTVYINEVRRDVTASGYQFPQAYISRSVSFGLGNQQYNWTDFKRVETNAALKSAIDNLQTQVNALKGLPSGIITMWSGSVDAIPDGWALCNGLNGTPNLQGRFIAGYSTTDADYNVIGKSGGSKTIILTEDQLPEHQFIVPWGESKKAHTPPWGWAEGYSDDRQRGSGSSDSDNSWMLTNPIGKGKAIDIRPSYYVLAYIMKL